MVKEIKERSFVTGYDGDLQFMHKAAERYIDVFNFRMYDQVECLYDWCVCDSLEFNTPYEAKIAFDELVRLFRPEEVEEK